MRGNEFHRRAHTVWVDAMRSVVGPTMPASITWRGAETIAEVLTPIMGSNNNHTHLPQGGGMDMLKVCPSEKEAGCLELFPDEDVLYLMKPKCLTLEVIERQPAESFFFLELDELEPTGVYASQSQSISYEPVDEEVVEIGPRQYVPRSVWDDGLLPDGRSLPRHARLVVRCFRGAAMLVAKRSLWNGTRETYDGRHSRMTPDQIRGLIERALDENSAHHADERG